MVPRLFRRSTFFFFCFVIFVSFSTTSAVKMFGLIDFHRGVMIECCLPSKGRGSLDSTAMGVEVESIVNEDWSCGGDWLFRKKKKKKKKKKNATPSSIQLSPFNNTTPNKRVIDSTLLDFQPLLPSLLSWFFSLPVFTSLYLSHLVHIFFLLHSTP